MDTSQATTWKKFAPDMNRKKFLEQISFGSGALMLLPVTGKCHTTLSPGHSMVAAANQTGYTADLVIAGGGVGACAAALAALNSGLKVIMTEETDWIGGQLTSQGVPPDEHAWIETHGATRNYRRYRQAVRTYYKTHYPLTDAARAMDFLNPGNGAVSKLCHEPRVSLAVLRDFFAPFLSSGMLTILLECKIRSADVSGDEIRLLKAVSLRDNKETLLTAPYFVDATEMGDLLPLTGTEYVTGTEARSETRELHAPEKGDPLNNQAFTMCFAMDYQPGANHVIDKPVEYNFWRNYVPKLTPSWPGKLFDLSYSNPSTLARKELGFNPDGSKTGDYLNLWNYRRIIAKSNFKEGMYAGDISDVNWPQNDYMLGNLVGAKEADFKHHVNRAKQLSLSLLYWLQTEVPRPDGGQGWNGLRLRPDVMGTQDGLAKYPYIRESRRIKAVFTVLEEHVGTENRIMVAGKEAGKTAASFFDSVGVGSYHIDLHPSTNGRNYIDFDSLPFEIPLGALLPQRMNNLIPACKNIGTTHITNGCYRLHPVEWGIGEAAGMLIAFALSRKVKPRQVREKQALLEEFQGVLRREGVELGWNV